jgi:hypothetical protein
VGLPLVALVLVILFALSPTAAPRAQEPRPVETPPVSQALPATSEEPASSPEERVREFVEANGGASRFGQSVSRLIEEASEGVTQTVQYYERGLLVYDPTAPRDEQVTAAPIGKMELARRYPQGPPASEAAVGEDLYFEGTGYAIAGAFREFWEAPGNAMGFGRPISGVFEEPSEGSGSVRTQYFEFGSMRQAAADPAAPVEAAPLGAERYRALHSTP